MQVGENGGKQTVVIVKPEDLVIGELHLLADESNIGHRDPDQAMERIVASDQQVIPLPFQLDDAMSGEQVTAIACYLSLREAAGG